jgi:hypothetical protein
MIKMILDFAHLNMENYVHTYVKLAPIISVTFVISSNVNSKIFVDFLFNFQWHKFFRILFLQHFRFTKYKITCIKMILIEQFSTISREWPNFSKILSLILLNFEWNFCSILNNSCNGNLNIMKPPWCTHTQGGLSKCTKSVTGVLWCGRSQHDKQASLLDRFAQFWLKFLPTAFERVNFELDDWLSTIGFMDN